MAVSDAALAAFAASRDIISLGIAADEERRRRFGARTTFVRVATVDAALDAPAQIPPTAGEIRIVGVPSSLASAVARVAALVPLVGM